MDKSVYKIGKDEVNKFIVKCSYGENAPEWPRATIVLSKVDIYYTKSSRTSNKEYGRFMINIYRNGWLHAENYFLTDLREEIDTLLKDKKIYKIQAGIVQNYSPCNNYSGDSGCADDILKFKEDMENRDINFSLTIKFANFYRHYLLSNRAGLQKLIKNNVNLQVFQGKQDWKAFLNDEKFVNLTNDDKIELLKRATSEERVKREKIDKNILKDITAWAKYNNESDVEDLKTKLMMMILMIIMMMIMMMVFNY